MISFILAWLDKKHQRILAVVSKKQCEEIHVVIFCTLINKYICHLLNINMLWHLTLDNLLVWKCFVSCQLHLYSQFWDSRYRYRNKCVKMVRIWYDFDYIIFQFGRCPMGQSTGWGGPDLEAPLSSWPCTTRACAGTASGEPQPRHSASHFSLF